MVRKLTVGLLVCASVGCAGKESKPADSSATTAAAAPTPNVVHVTASDFTFQMPDTIPAGMTTLVLQNSGTTLHHVQLLRLKDGKRLTDLQAGMKSMKPTDPPPPWVEEAGGVNTPEPGSQSSATVMIEPGTYAVVCFVDTPDKVPHLMKGMMKELTVTPSSGAVASAANPDITVTLSDYTFAFSTPLTPGKHVLKVDNTAAQHHEFVLFQLLPGKTLDDFAKWGADYKGPRPAKAIGGVPGMSTGQTEFVPVDLTAGDYVAICFLPDTKDGKPHMMHGMVMPIKVG
ncbi:MAG: hypothetical protein U0132_12915 [Gemmatimonadaceae bacterium]